MTSTRSKPDRIARLYHCRLTEEIQPLNMCASATKKYCTICI